MSRFSRSFLTFGLLACLFACVYSFPPAFLEGGMHSVHTYEKKTNIEYSVFSQHFQKGKKEKNNMNSNDNLPYYVNFHFLPYKLYYVRLTNLQSYSSCFFATSLQEECAKRSRAASKPSDRSPLQHFRPAALKSPSEERASSLVGSSEAR